MGAEMFQAALRLSSKQRWHVFPCRPGEKVPATANGLNDATTEWGQIIDWWNKHPMCNVGVRTGVESGVVVLDIDGDEGFESLRSLEREFGALPKTMTVKTPSGGQHYYFKHPGGEFRNSASKVGRCIDVRGDGGYVLVPPSRLRSGGSYEPDERAPIASVPEWLVEVSQRHTRSDAGAQESSEWLEMIRGGIAEGGRNHAMSRLVGHFLRRYVDVELTREVCHLVNRTKFKPALPDYEVDRTVDSVFARELQRREANA